MKAIAIMLLAFVLLGLSHAQDSATRPPSLRYRIAVTSFQLAATGFDAWRTDINRQSHGWEGNPVARPFVMEGRGRLVGYFGCQVALKLALPHVMRRMGHRRLAAAAEWYGIADNTWAGAYSWAHTTR